MLEYFLVGLACFISGFLVGDKFRKLQWGMMDWQVLKWDAGSFGYRIATKPAKVKKGDKAFLALPLNTDGIDPNEEIDIFES